VISRPLEVISRRSARSLDGSHCLIEIPTNQRTMCEHTASAVGLARSDRPNCGYHLVVRVTRIQLTLLELFRAMP
jgi:hypothetical protein